MPDLSNEESWEKHFKNIKKQIKDKLAIDLDRTITYNPYNNINSINATKSIETNILSSTNISQFWNLLTSKENVSCAAMNFRIGDTVGKKATIICVESIQNGTAAKLLFSREDEEDYDWDEVFNKQFIPFIKQATGAATGASADDEDEDVDYDELPFKIYKIKCDNALAIEKECALLNYDKIREKHDIAEEVDYCDVLEECYDKDDDSYFFIENKACFVICYGKQVFYWKPRDLKDVDDIDWDEEFAAMKKDVCDYFGLISNDKLKMINGGDKDVEIKQGSDMATLWDNIWEADDKVYLKIVVNGDPMIQFVIDCTSIGGTLNSKSMISLQVGLDIESGSDKQLFSQFLNALSPACGIRSSSLAQKYKFIDDCSKRGNLVPDAQNFVKICKTCSRNKISPIKLRLQQKVCCLPWTHFVHEIIYFLRLPIYFCFLFFSFSLLFVINKSEKLHGGD